MSNILSSKHMDSSIRQALYSMDSNELKINDKIFNLVNSGIGFESFCQQNQVLINGEQNYSGWISNFTRINRKFGYFSTSMSFMSSCLEITPSQLHEVVVSIASEFGLDIHNVDRSNYVLTFNNIIVFSFVISTDNITKYIGRVIIAGPVDLVESALKHLDKYLIDKDNKVDKTIEIKELTGWDRDGDSDWDAKTVKHKDYSDDFYPYIIDGAMNMMRDFMASDENILILYGDAGTGKSSLVAEAASALELDIVTALRRNVIGDPRLFKELFVCADEISKKYIESIKSGNAVYCEIDECSELTSIDIGKYPFFYKAIRNNVQHSRKNNVKNKRPVVLVEDADILLGRRTDGNAAMQEILNDTDGVASNEFRKIIFTTNLSDLDSIDPALVRDGRCFGAFDMQKLTPQEAITARATAGLPEFNILPTKPITLSAALAKPKKQYIGRTSRVSVGFTNK